MSFKILGTGRYIPEFKINNDELSKYVDTSDEWISKRVGVRERHISIDQPTYELGYRAALNALENANVDISEIDMILCSTVSGDYYSPSVSCMIQHKLKATCPTMDISAACSGFVYTMEVAANFFIAKKVKKILLVSAERISKILDWEDRGTCVIFGDGAGAVVLGEGENYLGCTLNTYGGDDVIRIPQTDAPSPFWEDRGIRPYIFMKGQETFKFAVNAMVNDITSALQKANIEQNQVNMVVPHQANKRIIEFAKRKLDINKDNYYTNMDRYGNTSSASIPIALDELNRSGKLKENDIIVFAAFGGGLSSGASVIRWNTNK